MDSLSLLTISLRGGKKHRATIISGLTRLWYSGANNIMIQSKYTITCECRIYFNKVEYSMDIGPYCTKKNKVLFCMIDFSSRNIILHHFHVVNNKFDLGIGYYMIIGHYLLVQLVLMVGLIFNYFNGMV